MSITSSVKTVNALTRPVKLINRQITSQQAHCIKAICLHKINNPPKIKQYLVVSTENEFNITKRLDMRYENTDNVFNNLKPITVFKFPIKYEKIIKQIRYEDEDDEDEEQEFQYSYGIMDNLVDCVFIVKSNDVTDMDSFWRTFSRGYVFLDNHIFPIFQTPYGSHVYPLGITPIYYWVLKYLDNRLINPRSNVDFEAIKTVMGRYTDVDVNMRIALDYRNNSCTFWNDDKKQNTYYFSLSKKDQRFIEPDYESDEDEYYEEYYNTDNDSD